jgi:outer membrane protein
MNYLRSSLAVPLLAAACLAQTPEVSRPEVSIVTPPETRFLGPLLRPFHLEKRQVSPAKLEDSPRLENLVRAGNLYLSSQDVIALALENNLDIAIQRYGSFLAREVQRRADSGQILRSFDTPILQGPQSVSTAGISALALGGSGVAAIGTIVTQAGPSPPSLDPSFNAQVTLLHTTSLETNQVSVGTSSLTDESRQYSFGYSQSFLTGTNVSVNISSNRYLYNSIDFNPNPFTAGTLTLTINQPFLQGLSIAVNNRDIRAAKNSLKFTDLQMKLQVITTIYAVLNLYWDLVSFDEDARLKQQALDVARKLYDDNRKQVELGTLPQIEVTRAAAEVSARQADLLEAQVHVAQQETVLKNTLSRSGATSAWLDDVHIIPLDRIEVPKTENLKPVAALIEQALAARPEMEQSKVTLASDKIMEAGTKNSLLPTLNGFLQVANNGLAGTSLCTTCPPGYFSGGEGTVLLQELRRNFPNYAAGISLNIPFRNRAAQGDYAADELRLRQAELSLRKQENQIRVEVKNAVMGLQQARSRYESSVNTRVLAEETLQAEQNRFNFGQVPDTTLVIQAQKDLVQYQTDEVQAMANYTHARIAFDFAVGQLLEVNHVSMDEAVAGHVARESALPATLPPGLPEGLR